MLDASLCMQIKSCLPFSNSNPQLKPTDIIIECDCPEPDEELGNNRRQSQQGSVGVGAASQRLIPMGERSGLWTRIARRKAFVVRADEILTAFTELERAIHKFAVNLRS